MAQYHVKNGGHLDKAFKVKGGHQVVPAGKAAEVADARELTDAQIDALARDGVKVTAKAGNGGQGGGHDAPKAYEAKHRGAGSWSIMDGDVEVREKLTKDQAETFNKLDADAKTKWLAANPKA